MFESKKLINWGEWSSAANAWNVIRNALDIPKRSQEIWIHPLKPVHLTGNQLTVQCPNPFFKEWIQDEYFDRLSQASEKIGISIYLTIQGDIS